MARIFVYRRGAFGDTVAMIPFLLALGRRYGEVVFAGNHLYRELFSDIDFIRFVDADSAAVLAVLNGWPSPLADSCDRGIVFSNGDVHRRDEWTYAEAVQDRVWFYRHPFDVAGIPFDQLPVFLPVAPDPQFDVPRKPYIVMHPSSGGRSKVWPIEYFLAVEARLEGLGYGVRYVLGESDAYLLGRIDSGRVLYNLPLKNLQYLLLCSAGFLGCDSGVAHLAGVLNVPGCVVFGPSSPEIYRPWGMMRVVAAQGGAIDGVSPGETGDALQDVIEESHNRRFRRDR